MGLFKRVVNAPMSVPLGILGMSALSLAACGATPVPAAIAVPTVVATEAPTATPTPNLTPAASAAYLAAATTANAADAALSKAYPEKSFTDAQAKRFWTRAETINRTFLTTIFAIAYPPSMKSDVDAQIAAQTKCVSDEAAMVYDSTGTNAQYNSDLNLLNADSATETGTANIVRHDLGLPQVPLK
jgi:hypothetical protein